MERFKKRTIALCLASALTVIGAFGAENYNNTLMALKINAGSGGNISMTAYTKKPISVPLKTTKLDNNTYVLTLSDTNNVADAPDIDDYDNIESIEISTYPYTTESDGYTKITVKTIGTPSIQLSQRLYIQAKTKTVQKETAQETTVQKENDVENNIDKSNNINKNTDSATDKSYKTDTNNEYDTNQKKDSDIVKNQNKNAGLSENNSGRFIITIFTALLMMAIYFIYMFSKDKMASVVGDQGDFDIDSNKNKNQKDKNKVKQKPINNKKQKEKKEKKEEIYNTSFVADEIPPKTEDTTNSSEEEQNVVDLDAVYRETVKTVQEEQDDNDNVDDLAELLSSFSFEEMTQEEVSEQEPFDDNLYNDIINNNNINFSDSDIQKINQLLQCEISEEIMDSLDNYLSKKDIKPPTKEQILEDLLSTYSIEQNIIFTEEDVNAIWKLMNVELSPNFTKDYTTNPVRTKAMEREIKENAGKVSHKASEIITLNVKSMLPDLSQELKKYKGKTIKSEVKPDVVYFSEGYEYTKLKVSDELSDISNNLHSNNNEHKPSYEAPIVDSGYNVSVLSIEDELPDLADAKAHPDKYSNKKVSCKADENALLKSIANVTFKPFYEENEENINDFDNFDADSDCTEAEQISLTVSDENTKQSGFEKEYNNDNAKDLMQLIEKQKSERAVKKQTVEVATKITTEQDDSEKEQNKEQVQGLYNFNGENYTILKTVKVKNNCECRIMRSESNYVITGRINQNEFFLKQYDSLKNYNMCIRQKDNTTNYLVKIGSHKFVINVTDNSMEFLMDLC